MQQIDPVLVGQRLRALREYRDLGSGAFADSVGIDRSSYSKIENGTKPLKAEMAFQISERWGVSMDYLYRGRLTELPADLANALTTPRTSQHR